MYKTSTDGTDKDETTKDNFKIGLEAGKKDAQKEIDDAAEKDKNK